jgi:hypothetical protein
MTTTAFRATIDLPPVARSVPAARRLLAQLLSAWAAEPLREIAELLVSELVTNVVRHVGGDGALQVQVRFATPVLRVTVTDSSTIVPTRLDPSAAGGHGMWLLAAVPTAGAWNSGLAASACGSSCVQPRSATPDEGAGYHPLCCSPRRHRRRPAGTAPAPGSTGVGPTPGLGSGRPPPVGHGANPGVHPRRPWHTSAAPAARARTAPAFSAYPRARFQLDAHRQTAATQRGRI